MMTETVFLADEAATLLFGETWSGCLKAPMVIYLNGDLGAGKTTFTRGVLRGLGYTGAVKSPTYAIVESYRLPEFELNHFDLYRFTYPAEWEDAGLDDLFTGSSIHLIEWSVQGGEFVPEADLILNFSVRDQGRECQIIARTAQGQRSLDLWQN